MIFPRQKFKGNSSFIVTFQFLASYICIFKLSILLRQTWLKIQLKIYKNLVFVIFIRLSPKLNSLFFYSLATRISDRTFQFLASYISITEPEIKIPLR